jgi:hypothetical protein
VRYEMEQVKAQLELTANEKNSVVKESKACVNNTEFKYS